MYSFLFKKNRFTISNPQAKTHHRIELSFDRVKERWYTAFFYDVQLLLITFLSTHSRVGLPNWVFLVQLANHRSVCGVLELTQRRRSIGRMCLHRRVSVYSCERSGSISRELLRDQNRMEILVGLLRRPAASMGVTWWSIVFHICGGRFDKKVGRVLFLYKWHLFNRRDFH